MSDETARVRQLLETLDVTAGDLAPEVLPHNRMLTPGVWRVVDRNGGPMLLKHLSAERQKGGSSWDEHWTVRDDEPARWNYWAREALAYRSGLTNIYAAAGLHAPGCIACDVNEREAVLLLEWVEGRPGSTWPVTPYGEVAEALGRAQGSIQPEWSQEWLSHGFLSDYSSEKPVNYALLDDDEVWAHPMARETFPDGLREAVGFVHGNRERLYQISKALPRTVCHLDVWPNNLIRRTGGELVLIDWAFVGDGAIGEDIGNLVPDSCFDHFLPAEQLPDLEQMVYVSYLRGLRTSGWNEDPRLVQLGMWSSAVKYDWLSAFTLAQLQQDKQYRYGGGDEIDATFKFRERSRTLAFNARWAEKAIKLADALGF